MTAYNFVPEVTKIPAPQGLGTVSGNVDLSGSFISPYHPWVVPLFCLIGIILMIVVYSYSELVWCKEKKK
jgi:hypothetical protein